MYLRWQIPTFPSPAWQLRYLGHLSEHIPYSINVRVCKRSRVRVSVLVPLVAMRMTSISWLITAQEGKNSSRRTMASIRTSNLSETEREQLNLQVRGDTQCEGCGEMEKKSDNQCFKLSSWWMVRHDAYSDFRKYSDLFTCCTLCNPMCPPKVTFNLLKI